jgi:hypothetical protein
MEIKEMNVWHVHFIEMNNFDNTPIDQLVH